MLYRFPKAVVYCSVVVGTLLGGFGLPVALAQNPNWSVNPPDFEQSMNVVGTLTINGTASTNPDDQVAAFVGTEIRGLASPITVSGTQYFFLTVYANGGTETITFQAYDATNDRVVTIAETVTFVANGVEGTLGTPFTWAGTGSQVAKPAVPVLQAPADGATHQPTTTALAWGSAARATSYDLQVATTAAFTTPFIDETGVTTTQFSPSGLVATTAYFWRVRAVGTGGVSTWSDPFSFTTGAATAPTLVQPADSTRNQPTTVSFLWSALPNTASYDVQLATDTDFTNVVASPTGITVAAYEHSGLTPGVTYHWRVRAVSTGGAGSWSAPFVFTTKPLAPAIPAILSPVHQTQNLPRALRLLWSPASRATSYDVQVATDAAFETLVAAQESVTETFFDLTGLQLATTYFWRVRGRNEGGVSTWATTFSFATARGSIPTTPTLLEPADGTQIQGTSVDFRWRSNRSDSYTIQVATDEAFTTIAVQGVGLSDTTFTASGLVVGTTYFWRVQASDGAASSVFSFTTVRPGIQVGVPVLQTPTDRSRDIPLEVRLTWAAATNAQSYDVQVAPTSAFATTFVDQAGVTATQLDVRNLASETTYFWRVRGRNGGTVSAWSTPLQWTTQAAVPLPDAPTLLLPRDGLISGETSIRFSWQGVGGSSRYHVQVSTQIHFGSLLIDQEDVDDTAFSLSNLEREQDYFWRVRSVEATGFSAWSDIFQFRIAPLVLPDAPVLQTPADQATEVNVSPELRWALVTNIEGYDVQVSTTEDFADLIFRRDGVRTTRQAVTGLAWGSIYFWRVRSRSTAGAGDWSTPFQFTTEAVQAPSAPTLTAPADKATNQALDVKLAWNAASGATQYDVQVATDSGFQTLVMNRSGVTASSVTAAALQHNTTYVWRVRSVGSGGASTWSTSFSFTTRPAAAPDAITLSIPADNATNQALDVSLQWQAAASATTYHVQVATDMAFATLLVDQADLTTTAHNLSNADYEATYFWRVRGQGAGGVGAWSPARSFITGTRPEAPRVPALAAPINGAIEQPVAVPLVWRAGSGATTYHVQVASDADFTSLAIDATGVAATTFITDGLRPLSTYFWRVRGTGPGGLGTWSPTFSFTTAALPGTVTLTFPEDSATNLPPALSLRWDAAEDATTYALQIATFGEVVIEVSDIADTQHVVQDLTAGTTYNWRVRAVGPGGAGEWSLPFRFTVATIPESLALLTPIDRANNQPTDAALHWETIPNAVLYDLQVGLQSDFGQLHADVGGLTTNEHTVQGLAANTTYYWRARAISLAGEGHWSTIRRFTTGLPIPTVAPTPVGPRDGDIVSGTDPIFVWSPTPVTTTYRLQIATDPSFDQGEAVSKGSGLILDTTGLADAFFALPPGLLDYNATYYWRTQGQTVSGAGPWGSAFSFRTPIGTSTEADGLPTEFSLADNYPNPFNPTTTIQYSLPSAEHVSLIVFDMLGREVRVLVDAVQATGTHTIAFDAAGLPSGPYLYRLQAGHFVATKQMVLIK